MWLQSSSLFFLQSMFRVSLSFPLWLAIKNIHLHSHQINVIKLQYLPPQWCGTLKQHRTGINKSIKIVHYITTWLYTRFLEGLTLFCVHCLAICFHWWWRNPKGKHVFWIYLSTSEVVFESRGWGVLFVLSDTSSSDWAMEIWWWRDACSKDMMLKAYMFIISSCLSVFTAEPYN